MDGSVQESVQAEFVSEAAATILPDKNDVGEIIVKFMSTRPVSTTVRIKITDEQNREYTYSVVVTADNSLFTCYAFLADHQAEYHIVLEPGRIMKGSRTNQQNQSSIGTKFII